MNCFYPPDKPAIGLCKHCKKGLCIDCASDLEHGLAYKNKHEAEVENINMIISKNTKVYASASKNTLIAPIFYILAGLVFAGFGFFSRGGITDLPFVLGVVFIVFGVVMVIRNRNIFGKNV
ncbi:MAG: hypothetical protein JW927_21665 [Deltaproteobacteria bacterium]|nr:hypothetical protein [Deltaproteobacteria bacterium]